MKPAGIVFSAFLFATAIQAADPATPPPANPAQPDSPLVAASKRAHRLGKKPGFVITNDNLSSLSGPARITTTNHVQTTIPVPPSTRPDPGPEPQASPAKPVMSEAEKQRRLARAAAMAEATGESLYPDPAVTSPEEDAEGGQGARQTPPANSNQPHASTNTTNPKP
jgi:hypothetical protein